MRCSIENKQKASKKANPRYKLFPWHPVLIWISCVFLEDDNACKGAKTVYLSNMASQLC